MPRTPPRLSGTKPNSAARDNTTVTFYTVTSTLVLLASGWLTGAESSSWALMQPVVARLDVTPQIQMQQGMLHTFGRVMPMLLRRDGKRWPVHRRLTVRTAPAMPKCMTTTAVALAGHVADEDLARTQLVALRAVGGRKGRPTAPVPHQVPDHRLVLEHVDTVDPAPDALAGWTHDREHQVGRHHPPRG